MYLDDLNLVLLCCLLTLCLTFSEVKMYCAKLKPGLCFLVCFTQSPHTDRESKHDAANRHKRLTWQN